jgi:sugar phosphate isomerase/epimerase
MALDHPLSFQMYSARKFPPVAAQLELLKSLGYTNVEPFGDLYTDASGFKALLDQNGLKAESGHFAVSLLEDQFDKALGIIRTLGCSIAIAPYLMPEDRPKDAAGWKAFGKRLGAIAARLKGEGIEFAWHNHDFEFIALPDGSLPIEHLMADALVQLELDVAWVVRAGADPARWLDHFAGRIIAVHVKDIAPAGQKADEDGWADVGAGTVPWKSLWPKAVAAGARLMVAEHDNPNDFKRFAATSAKAMAALAG